MTGLSLEELGRQDAEKWLCDVWQHTWIKQDNKIKPVYIITGTPDIPDYYKKEDVSALETQLKRQAKNPLTYWSFLTAPVEVTSLEDKSKANIIFQWKDENLVVLDNGDVYELIGGRILIAPDYDKIADAEGKSWGRYLKEELRLWKIDVDTVMRIRDFYSELSKLSSVPYDESRSETLVKIFEEIIGDLPDHQKKKVVNYTLPNYFKPSKVGEYNLAAITNDTIYGHFS